MSTVTVSGVAAWNGCTSLITMISATSVRCAIAEAAMSVRMIRRGSIASCSVAAVVLAYRNHPSIPFRREAEIGQPALGTGERGDQAHLLGGQFEVEYLDIFREPLDARGARDGRHVLLHQPAQADL